jgi:hypothetical protein
MKPIQYQIGIDTFERMESNCTQEEILAFCKGNIDKYNWRKKGSDKEDFEKIIDYANFAIKQIDKEQWYDEQSTDDRINIIGQNGNNGEHYENN